MTIQYAVDYVNRTKRNAVDRKDMISALSRLDHRVKLQIIDTHEGAEKYAFYGYDETTDLETQLLVPVPYDEMYLRYLEAEIERLNGQEDDYNNAIDLFNRLWQEFKCWYNRTHMPIGRVIKY